MGLPVWRAPSPEARKEAVKSDVTAPARSPIRRRSPTFTSRRARPARALPSPHPLDANLLAPDAHLLPAFPPFEPLRRNSGSQARPPFEPVGGYSGSQVRLPPPPPAPETRNYGVSHARPGQSARDTAYRSIYEFGLASQARPAPYPFPPYTRNFAPAAASLLPPLPRGEAPAGFAAWIGSLDSRAASNAPERARDDGITEAVNNDGESASDDAVGLPPLRRMGRRTIADGPLPSSSLRESWSPATTLDGLGDRDRSLSPVDDPWDTFLSTVAPDPLTPTADSSFTSAAASASFSNSSNPSSRAGSSNSNSAASERTHLTVPSRRDSPPSDMFMRACDTSDDDTASDTEAEDDEAGYLRATQRFMRNEDDSASHLRAAQRFVRHEERRSRRAARTHEDFLRRSAEDEEEYRRRRAENSALDASQPSAAAAPVADHARRLNWPLSDQLDGPAEVPPSNGEPERQSFDQEIRDARDIIERLVQSEGISDEFWASVGLTRSMADRVERIQQREH